MNSTQQPIVYLVDADEAFLTAVARLLRTAGYVVRSYTNAGAFLLAKMDEGPGCILMDAHLPGPSGLDLQKAIAQWPNPLPIIFATASSNILISMQAMEAGAVDLLTKPIDEEILLGAVERALELGEQERTGREQMRYWRASFETLTQREKAVFTFVVDGKMNKEIAAELGIAERTVKAHRAQVMLKMHADSLATLVHIACELQNGARARDMLVSLPCRNPFRRSAGTCPLSASTRSTERSLVEL